MRSAFATEVEAERHWSEGRPRRWRGRRAADEIINEVAHFAAGALVDAKFRLFKNGGLPLLERRRNAWIQELLIRPSEMDVDGEVRIRVDFCLSHPEVQHIRSRYWRPASRAPIGVAHGNIGELDLPPGYLFWTTSGDIDDYEDIAAWIRELALPWFLAFDNADDLEETLLGRGLPKIGHADALEILVAFGKMRSARRYLRDFVLDARFESLWQHSEAFGAIPIDSASDLVRSAIVARTFNLA